MAGFADIATATGSAVHPVIERNVARVDAVVGDEWVAALTDERFAPRRHGARSGG